MGLTDFYFDERAKDWDADPEKVERARVVAEAIRTRVPLPPGTRLLDYGCGTGLLGFALQPYLAAVSLADISPGMLEMLTGKIKTAGVTNMTPVRLDLGTDPLPAERYHVIASLMALHHIPDTQGILLKFHTLLEPGGYIAIADLEKEDGSFHGTEMTDVHLGFEREALQAQAEAAGFGEVAFSTVHQVLKGDRAYPIFLMTGRA
jgi:2-polyprenyl-3-methyl-5-hydroxy-6-metoxy-1,4-benzoquinol methylase